jgi:hypothetical protein
MRFVSAVLLCLICDGVFASQTIGSPVNATKTLGHQSEAAIGINPIDSQNIIMFSNTDQTGLFKSLSTDGGATWTHSLFATGFDGLPVVACCDPSVMFDKFGNCWLAYLGDSGATHDIVVVRSIDKCATFQHISTIQSGDVDQPTIVTGPASNSSNASVWVLFLNSAGSMAATGANVSGLGSAVSFGTPQTIPGSSGCNFGDIAIGPNGQVAVTYQQNDGFISEGPSDMFFNVDLDGLGPNGFSAAVKLRTLNVGPFRTIPAQPNRTIDSEVAFAYDNSGGPFTGRLYLMILKWPLPTTTAADRLLAGSI